MITKIENIAVNIYIFLAVMSLLYFGLGELFLPDEKDYFDEDCVEFEADWERILDNGQREKTQIPGNVDVKQGEKLILETTLPELENSDRILIVRSSKQAYEVYVDDELRMTYNTDSSRLLGKTNATRYLFLKLDKADSGKKLRLESSMGLRYNGVLHPIMIGSYGGFWNYIVKTQGLSVLIGLLMLFFSIFALIGSIAFYYVYKKHHKLTDISLGVFILALWIVCNSAFRQIVFPNLSVVSDITFICVGFMSVPFSRFMDNIQGNRYHKIYLVQEVLAIIDIVVVFMLQLFNIMDFYELFGLMAIFFIACILIIIGTIIADIVTKNVNQYIVTAVLIFAVCFMGIGQVVCYVVLDTTIDVGIAAIGLTLILLVAVLDSVKDIMENERQKQKALEANELKTQFLANMSHEIRTPINAILGMNEMILEESDQSQVRSYAKDVEYSSKALLAIVNDVLDFSKIESGKLEINNGEYTVSELFDRLYILVSPRLIGKNIKFNAYADENIPEKLFGDESKLQQILLNILTNAAKYTKEGTIDFKISYTSGNKLVFSVKDTGQGIKEEDMVKMFDSFKRLDESRNRTIEGTGLGLAITKKLVELMGGTIEVNSVYGEGSEFIVTIEQQPKSEKTIGKYNFPNSKKNVEKHKSKDFTKITHPENLRVLVVDDVAMNLKVFKGLLKKTGIKIDTAGSGKEAIEYWKTTKYNIVFLDHMMPEMDGIECYRIMKSITDGPNKDTPVAMLSANAVAGIREKYMSEGFVDYLAKPFVIEEVIAIIENNCEDILTLDDN